MNIKQIVSVVISNVKHLMKAKIKGGEMIFPKKENKNERDTMLSCFLYKNEGDTQFNG